MGRTNCDKCVEKVCFLLKICSYLNLINISLNDVHGLIDINTDISLDMHCYHKGYDFILFNYLHS